MKLVPIALLLIFASNAAMFYEAGKYSNTGMGKLACVVFMLSNFVGIYLTVVNFL